MSELKIIARHAGSVWAGQLAVMAFGVTDTLVAGRHSDAALAALSIGYAIYISVYVALVTVVQALLPVWAELQGAKQFLALGRSVRQALYLCAIIAAVGLWLLLYPAPLLQWTQVPTRVQTDVERYLAVLALSFIPALLFRMYSTLNQSLGRPLLVTWLQLGALVVKVPLSFAFGLGISVGGVTLPAMGAEGCAWATVIVNGVMLALAVVMLRTQPLYQPYQLWRPLEAPDRQALAKFARLGVPTGLAVMVEITSFTLMALFIARMGTVASAAHQIASNTVAVLYMLPLAIGIATSARVSFWLGAGKPQQAKQVIFQGFMLTAVAACGFSALIFTTKDALAMAYTSNPQVAQVTVGLLSWIALFHLADALQAVSGFVLRSYRVALAPLVIYATLLWALGLGGAYLWAYVGWNGVSARPEPSTFWIASTGALALAAIALMSLLAWTVKHASAAPGSALAK